MAGGVRSGSASEPTSTYPDRQEEAQSREGIPRENIPWRRMPLSIGESAAKLGQPYQVPPMIVVLNDRGPVLMRSRNLRSRSPEDSKRLEPRNDSRLFQPGGSSSSIDAYPDAGFQDAHSLVSLQTLWASAIKDSLVLRSRARWRYTPWRTSLPFRSLPTTSRAPEFRAKGRVPSQTQMPCPAWCQIALLFA